MSTSACSETLKVLLLAAALCLAHGVFELTFDKRAGVMYLREAVLVVVVLGAVWVIVRKPALLRLRILTFSLLYVVAFVGLSTLLAWLWFRQPPLFGLLEERRMFDVLWLFVMIGLVCILKPDMSTIVKAYCVAGLVLSLYSALYYFSVITDNEVSGVFIEQHYYADDDPRNQTRYVLSTTLPLVVIPLALASWRDQKRASECLLLLSALVALLFTVVCVNQTRTLMAFIVMISTLVVLQRSSRFGLPVAVLLMLLVSVSGATLLLTSSNEKVRWMFDSMLHGQQVRLNTIAIILTELKAGWYWGHGALSVQFNRGFLTIYNENFWLNDVGKLGLFYRFGFLLVPFVAFYIYVARYLWRASSAYRCAYFQVVFWIYMMLLVNPMGNIAQLGAVELGLLTGWLINHESDASRSAVSSIAGRSRGFRVESGAQAARA